MALGVKRSVPGVQYLYVNDVTGVYYVRPKGKSYITLAATTKIEAIEEMGTKMRQSRIEKPKVTRTMEEHWQAVLDFQTGNKVDEDEKWGERTLEQHVHHYTSNIREHLGELMVADIDDLDCLLVLDTMKDEGYEKNGEQRRYSGSTLRQCYMTMSMLFRYAQERRFGPLRNDSPLGELKIPKAVKVVPLTKEEILTDLDVKAIVRVSAKREARLFELADLTGLRTSELLGLQLCNHDAKASTLQVESQLRRRKKGDKGELLKGLKGDKSIAGCKARELQLSPSANRLLMEMRLELANEDGVSRLLPGETFFFQTRSGLPLSHRNVARDLLLAREAAGVERPCTMHSFRHHYASRMFAAGATVEEVAEDLGNTPEVCRAYYVRLIDSAVRVARKAELYLKAGMA